MHIAYLQRALQLAQTQRGFCAPNPAVGAVIVKNQRILAQAYHEGPGKPHAEVAAMALTSEDLSDAELYVTLEPCNHHGRTPPCVGAIIERGIRRVYYGYSDPNPDVCGQGAAALRAAGVTCEYVADPEITLFYRSYTYWCLTKLPWVTAKLALTLDGRSAAIATQPYAITGAICQRDTHYHRYHSDALLTTAATVRADDPQLNARIDGVVTAKPVLVCDSRAQLTACRLQTTAKSLSVFTGESYAPRAPLTGVTYIALPQHGQHLDLAAVKRYAGQLGLHDIWLEAGAACFTAWQRAELLNSAVLYIAPKVLATDPVIGLTTPLDFTEQAKTIRWQAMGNDVAAYIDF